MSSRVPRLPLNRLPRMPSQHALLSPYLAHLPRRHVLWLLAAGLTVVAWLFLVPLLSHPHYVLVIDAGSSGTRMYAYTWRDGAGPGGGPLLNMVPSTAAPHKVPRRALPGKRAYQRVETEPGLDRFAGDQAGLQARALGPLLEWAEAVVPPRHWARTPVFLLGTAGLRKLSEEQQRVLLQGVQHVLAGSSFRFQPSWARIISGTDEGVFGWIALNYLQGTLHGGKGGPGGGTLGALDLGGSSLEVTFAAGSVPWEEDAVNATLLGASHQLYAHVHHHYGLNDAFERSVSLLLSRPAPAGEGSAGGGDKQQQAAGHAGAQQAGSSSSGSRGGKPGRSAAEDAGVAGAGGGVEQVDGGTGGNTAAIRSQATAGKGQGRRRLLQAPAALLRRLLLTADAPSTQQVAQGAQQHGRQLGEGELPQVVHPCLHDGYQQQYKRLPLDGAGVPDPPQVLLVGRPDWEACRQLAQAVVNATAPCSAPPCALGTPQPSSAGHRFVALTGFYVVYRFFRLPNNASLTALEQEGQSFCGMTWKQVQQERAGELMVQDYCFRAPYIAALLRQGLLLADEQLEIGSGDVGWTLGAALAEGYRLAGMGAGSNGAVLLSWAPWAHGSGALWQLLGLLTAALLVYTVVVRWRLSRLPGASNSLRGWLARGGLGGSKLQTKGSAEILPITSPRVALPGSGLGGGGTGTGLDVHVHGQDFAVSLPVASRSSLWLGGGSTQQVAVVPIDLGSSSGSSAGGGGGMPGSSGRTQSWAPDLVLAPGDVTGGGSSSGAGSSNSIYTTGRGLNLSRTLSRRTLAASTEGGSIDQ